MATQSDAPPVTRDELTAWFEGSTRPDPADHKVGTELENFGLVLPDGECEGRATAVRYDPHVKTVLETFIREYGWKPSADRGTNGEIVGLERDRAGISLEPGGQFELSGKPLPHVHATCEEFSQHYEELHAASRPLGIAWLSAGFHPLASLADINHMPKGRYDVMRAYLPTRGGRGLDMMHRTCTVQANFDYTGERQCGERLRVAMGLSALSTALFANSPYYEGEHRGRASERSEVWSDVDPDRCGLHEFMLGPAGSFSFERYVDWALQIPMFFVKRDGRYLAHHVTFAEYMERGFTDDAGVHHRATAADWRLHLNTLFPEVRLNPFIEVRGADAAGSRYVCSLPALWKGILYDDDAREEAWSLVADFDMAQRLDLWKECRTAGLRSPRVQGLCRRLLAIARASLDRQNVRDRKDRTEARFLDSLDELVETGASHAHLAVERVAKATAGGRMFDRAVVETFHFAGACGPGSGDT